MRRIAFLTTVLAITASSLPVAALVAPSEPPQWQILPDQSHIIFHAKQMGADIDGRLEKFTADIFFSPYMLPQSRVSVSVPIDGLNSDYDKRDDTLKGPDWFDAAKYPLATYNCTGFTLVSGNAEDGDYLCKGTLTLRDVTKPFDLPFHLKLDNDTAYMSANPVLNRLDFDLGRGDWADSSIIAGEVTLDISVTAKQ